MTQVTYDPIKHMEFIQGVISRLSSNSFLIKGWTITVTTGLLALAVNNSTSLFAVVAALAAVAFWCLDAVYLRRERMYRCLYEAVSSGSHQCFSMDTDRHGGAVERWFRILWSGTLFGLHGPVVLVAVLTALCVG